MIEFLTSSARDYCESKGTKLSDYDMKELHIYVSDEEKAYRGSALPGTMFIGQARLNVNKEVEVVVDTRISFLPKMGVTSRGSRLLPEMSTTKVKKTPFSGGRGYYENEPEVVVVEAIVSGTALFPKNNDITKKLD